MITLISESIGVKIDNRDFIDFVELESEFQSLIYRSGKKRNLLILQWILFDRMSFYVIRKLRNDCSKSALRIKRLIDRLLKKT